MPNHRDPLLAVRERIAALKAECQRVRTAPLPLAEARARVREAIAQAAAKRLPMDIQEFVAPHRVGGFDLSGELQRRPTALLADLLGDAIAARLERDLQAFYAGPEVKPLPGAGRDTQLAKLDRDLLDAEREEERLVRQIEEVGGSVDRRADADPAAVLMED